MAKKRRSKKRSKKARKSKGHIPLTILKKRLAKLTSIVKKRS